MLNSDPDIALFWIVFALFQAIVGACSFVALHFAAYKSVSQASASER